MHRPTLEDIFIRLVTSEALRVALWGAAVGIAAALGLARLLGAMVYGVSARDPMSLLGAALAVVAVAVAASGLPAWRGSRVDPMIALRGE